MEQEALGVAVLGPLLPLLLEIPSPWRRRLPLPRRDALVVEAPRWSGGRGTLVRSAPLDDQNMQMKSKTRLMANQW